MCSVGLAEQSLVIFIAIKGTIVADRFRPAAARYATPGAIEVTTDDLKFFAGLSVITLVVISLLVYLGLKLNKAVGKHAADIRLPLNITLTGTALYACLVAFWIYCAAVLVLSPESQFGGFLNTEGVAITIVGSISVVVIANAILERFGYPSFKRGDEP
jgi:hypothetical protein